MNKLYKNIYIIILIFTPYILIGMKGPANNTTNTNVLDIQKNNMSDGSVENQYYNNGVFQFSLKYYPGGLVKLNYEAANDNQIEFILTPTQRDCPQKDHFDLTPDFFYTNDKSGAKAQDGNTLHYRDYNNLRSYSVTNYGNSIKEKFYNTEIVKLDRTLLKDTSKSMKDIGIKLEIDTNKFGNRIETLYYPNNTDVIKFYSQSEMILFELIIETYNYYTAQLIFYDNNKKLQTNCYKISDIHGIVTDFHQYRKLPSSEALKRLPANL